MCRHLVTGKAGGGDDLQVRERERERERGGGGGGKNPNTESASRWDMSPDMSA